MKQNTFLAQSYQDAWKDYEYSLNNEKAAKWDWIIITASNERQADAYQLQIDKRMEEGRLPNSIFAVIPDLDGKRIGSGGATLNVLKYISDKIGINSVVEQKILVIHSGGDSKRIPQYSACGKLFAPVPRCLPNGKRATIFDELLIAVSGLPARINSGMMVLPSDTVILYNPLQLDLLSCDVVGLSIKASVEEGREHGVFLKGENNYVQKFLHKQSEQNLRELGAVDENGNVDIDTGCIWLGIIVVKALLDLLCENGEINETRFRKFVNPKVCLSFYADFIFPMAQNATLDDYYKETPEGTFSDELRSCRTEIWEKLHLHRMVIIRMTPARYIHFGTTHEMFDLFVHDIDQYAYIGWEKQIVTNANVINAGAVSNSYISNLANVSENSYVEDSIIGEGCKIGNGSIISSLSINKIEIPDNVVLHNLKLKNGKYVCRIYGREDNPKSSMSGQFLGKKISNLTKSYDLKYSDIWNTSIASIWNADLYPECDSPEKSIDMALLLYRMIQGMADMDEVEKWKNSRRYSLKHSFNLADVNAIIEWQEYLEHIVRVEKCIGLLVKGNELKQAIAVLDDSRRGITELGLLYKRAKISSFPVNMRIYLAISTVCKKNKYIIENMNSDQFEDLAYQVISEGIIDAIMEKHGFNTQTGRFCKKSEKVMLPVRVNFCGSPSDAAPYCLEHGGTMFDGVLLLKGKKPICAEVKRLDEPCFILESIDLKMKKKITDINEIRNCSNPYDILALHKAVLVATGLIPLNIENLTMEKLCDRLGGGVYMSTSVDVPKGSGLGTSSIVAAACIKAVNSILCQDASDDCIYSQVFAAEQLMTTGGGWQDQVGGLTPGLKLMKSMPGMYQKIDVEYVNLPESTMKELKDRFILIFSGQRRLARNVLREELNQCIRNDEKSMVALERIRELCVIMKYQLERGNVTEFARCITEQFTLIKILDKGASNTCIEYIFDVCDDLIVGKSICGAGGGGFLQVILKEGITKDQLKKRINDEFLGCGVEVWDCELI